MSSDYAKLDGRNVVPATLAEFAELMHPKNAAARKVGVEQRGHITVSTVFLGMDHSFGHGPALWFETMIFGGEHDQHQERCTTWAEAEEMHKRAVALAWPDKETP